MDNSVLRALKPMDQFDDDLHTWTVHVPYTYESL